MIQSFYADTPDPGVRPLAPLAALATACSLLVYLAVQQAYRQLANDPQLQVARDVSNRLDAGARPGDLVGGAPDATADTASFVLILDDRGGPVAASVGFAGVPHSIPAGVVDATRLSGEDRITWQPAPGLRLAAVVVRRAGAHGFVLAARSLGEFEARTAQWGLSVLLAWLATLVGLFVIVWVSEIALSHALLN